jgi:hypothetical protein
MVIRADHPAKFGTDRRPEQRYEDSNAGVGVDRAVLDSPS